MVPANSYRCGNHQISSEHGRGGRAIWRKRECKVGASTNFDSCGPCGKEKSLGNGKAHALILTSGIRICGSRGAICCGIGPRTMAISSHAKRLGQWTQSL